jgi:hypothetical protein
MEKRTVRSYSAFFGGRQIAVCRAGVSPLHPTKELFENLLAFARGEFAFGKYREVLWNLKNFKNDYLTTPF